MTSELIIANPSLVHSQHFQSTTFTSPRSGVRILITGAVHGNEICGTHAIKRVIKEIESGLIKIKSGMVTFVPITNPLAYQNGEREGDRNLNRRLRPTQNPTEFEDHVANWLCPLMQRHQVLLDLHSFRSEGQAFVMVGPENNNNDIEAFQFAKEEEALAQVLGVHRFVDGWLSTYAKGVQRRQHQIEKSDLIKKNDIDTAFGMGTTEYMRSVGGYALTLECGQHQDPNSKEVAYNAIINALGLLHIIDTPSVKTKTTMETLRIYEVIDKEHDDDQFSQNWASFDEIKKGELIGVRNDGSPLLAEFDTRIIFPDANAKKNEEWFYLAKQSERLKLS